MTAFTDLLSDFESEKHFLCVLEPYDYDAGEVVTLYYSSHGFTSEPGDVPSSTYYEARLKTAFEFSRSLFQQGKVSGRSIPGYGRLSLNNQDGALDNLGNMSWRGRRVRVWLGGKDFALSDYGLIFDGVAEDREYGDEEIGITLRDLSYKFDKEIQNDKFLGNGGTEGAADLTDKRKPFGHGVCRNVEPVYLGPDSGNHLFCVGPVIGILRVLDVGIPLDFVVSSPAAGEWTVDVVTGVITLGGAFIGPVTVDLIGKPYLVVTSATSNTLGTGAKSFTVAASQPLALNMRVRARRTSARHSTWADGLITSYSGTSLGITFDGILGSGTFGDWEICPYGTVAGVLKDIADGYGITLYDDASIAALNALQPATIGYWIPEGGNGLEILDAIADGAGCFYGFDRAGQFEVGRIDGPGVSTDSYDVTQILSIEREATEDPYHEVIVRYRKNHHVHDLKDVDGTAADPDKTFLTNEWRQVSSGSDPDVLEAFPEADALEVDSIFDELADAEDEADRLAGLFGVPRSYFRVLLKIQPLARENAETVTIVHDRYQLSAGKDVIALDVDSDMDDYQVELGLWG